MNYIVTTTWSHPNEMNKAEMADYQKNNSDRPEVVNIYWFEVDPKTHGAVVVYKDKASYEAALEGMQEIRKQTNELGIKMLHEATGECFAILRE